MVQTASHSFFFGLDLQSIIIPASTCNLRNRRGLSSYIHLEGQFSFPRILSFIAYILFYDSTIFVTVLIYLTSFLVIFSYFLHNTHHVLVRYM